MAVRVGIAGLRFGLSWARLFAAYQRTELVAVCDILPEKCGEAVGELDGVAGHSTFGDLLADDRVDAVGIFTPAPLHAAQVMQAMAAGKHVLCAVPAAMTMEESRELAAAVTKARAHELTYMMAENWVYEPTVIRARELYLEGMLGRLHYAEAEYVHGTQELRRHADGSPTWRNSLAPLLYPTHGTSPFLSITGDRLESVTAFAASGRREFQEGYEADWVQTAIFRSSRGALFRLMNSFQNVHGMSHFLSFYGDQGSFETGRFKDARTVCAYSTSEGGKDEVIRETCSHPVVPGFSGGTAAGHGHTSMGIIADFVSAVEGEKPSRIDIHAALDMTLPGIAGVQAIRDGGTVVVPDSRDWVLSV